ncbi:hypothetical protein V6N13_098953 [Hibiscus sabdariffa]|uniref:Uncharacterized protein n=1 Tax=Hibiscus sabdariffa TaxID=183260 RepID=A0ABR2P939_9ROSI
MMGGKHQPYIDVDGTSNDEEVVDAALIEWPRTPQRLTTQMALMEMTWCDPTARSTPEVGQRGTSPLMCGVLNGHKSRDIQGTCASRTREGNTELHVGS